MRIALCIVIAVFGGFTIWVVSQVGYLGFFRSLLSTAVGWQAFTDLCISLVLFTIWMTSDAKQSGRSPWIYLLITLFLGSLGPLLYLAQRTRREATNNHWAT
jgi:hypothetical protein